MVIILYPKHCACNKLWYSHNSHNVDISTIIFHVYVMKSTGRDKTEDENTRKDIVSYFRLRFGKGVLSMSFMVSAYLLQTVGVFCVSFHQCQRFPVLMSHYPGTACA